MVQKLLCNMLNVLHKFRDFVRRPHQSRNYEFQLFSLRTQTARSYQLVHGILLHLLAMVLVLGLHCVVLGSRCCVGQQVELYFGFKNPTFVSH